MTTYRDVEVKCAVCGHTFTRTVIMSSNSFGSMDLDTRPAPMERNNLRFRIVECPNCHYAAGNIDEVSPAVKEYIESGEYLKSLNLNQKGLAETYRRAAILKEFQHDMAGAMFHYLRAAWVCDDFYSKAGSHEFRRLANSLLLEYGEEMTIDPETRICIHADVARRCGDFGQVISLQVKHALSDPMLQALLDFQVECAIDEDIRCYTVEEALATMGYEDKENGNVNPCSYVSWDHEPYLNTRSWVRKFPREKIAYYYHLGSDGSMIKYVYETVYSLVADRKCGIIFAIQQKNTVPSSPKLVYDGQGVACLMRDSDEWIFLNDIRKNIRKRLLNSTKVFVLEVMDGKIVLAYEVPVETATIMPVFEDTESLLEYHLHLEDVGDDAGAILPEEKEDDLYTNAKYREVDVDDPKSWWGQIAQKALDSDALHSSEEYQRWEYDASLNDKAWVRNFKHEDLQCYWVLRHENGDDNLVKVIHETYHTVFLDDKGGVTIAIQQKNHEPFEPKIVYDGGDVLYLSRSCVVTIVLPQLKEEFRKALFEAEKVHVIEVKEGYGIILSYDAPVERVSVMETLEPIGRIEPYRVENKVCNGCLDDEFFFEE